MKKIFSFLLFTFFILIISSCQNEPVDIVPISQEDLISVNSTLYQNIKDISRSEPENVTACIEFIYKFTIIVYDSNLEIVDYQLISNDEEFIVFLESLDEGLSISLSYPIQATLANGDILVINNNDELAENLKTCIDDETLQYCNALLKNCFWNVETENGVPNDYEGAFFELSENGYVWFHYNQDIYLGTWITLFIEDQLHLNIHLLDADEVGNDWNFDWKATVVGSNQINISNGENSYTLRQECFSPCKKLVFEECEIEQGSDTAEFYLETYIDCFIPFTEIEDVSLYTITFYESYEDAFEGDNPLNATTYLNTINPQKIYVKFVNNDTLLTETIITIYLASIPCN